MAEYVHVPVSLMRKWSEDLILHLPPGTFAIVGEMRALLSQPTPSAEYEDMSEYAQNERRHRQAILDGWAAEPPGIEDMAPGTTFRIDREELWTVIENRVAVCSQHHVGRYLEVFDPSTIRDVTPPKEPTA